MAIASNSTDVLTKNGTKAEIKLWEYVTAVCVLQTGASRAGTTHPAHRKYFLSVMWNDTARTICETAFKTHFPDSRLVGTSVGEELCILFVRRSVSLNLAIDSITGQ